ncbi:MAG: hypothetical protein ACQEXN_15710 [Actinomycetota bacterium]
MIDFEIRELAMKQDGTATVVQKAREELDLSPRTSRWGHLSLCLLAATFSIGARYNAAVVPTVKRYAKYADLNDALVYPENFNTISPRSEEQTLSQFLKSVAEIDDEEFAAEVLKNKQLTSARGGIRKAAAVRQLANILVDYDVEVLADVPQLLADPERLEDVETAMRRVKGSGQNGIRTGYIWMTAGDDMAVKPDRHILRWISSALGRRPSIDEARRLLAATADELGTTPWVLDHAIWRQMSRRSALPSA